ncbi:MAG: PAS domain S-box protein [Chlamydiae bacterium]|jgi:two-component system, cell cycle sensor histidine kinase and response regulator CckA|nr:PAS domain S-box protein [Chlamydiota bacterium]
MLRDSNNTRHQEEDLILFHELIDRSSDFLSIIDLHTGQYLYVNEAACMAIGYTRDEFRALSVADIDPSITRPWDEEKERERRVRKSVFIREGLIRRKDGTDFPVEVSSSIVSLPGGDYMVAMARDISERKHAEKLLRDSCNELDRRVKERTAELVNGIIYLTNPLHLLRIGEADS